MIAKIKTKTLLPIIKITSPKLLCLREWRQLPRDTKIAGNNRSRKERVNSSSTDVSLFKSATLSIWGIWSKQNSIIAAINVAKPNPTSNF